MKILALICRIVLGAGFVFFGLNILHPFAPMPAPTGIVADFFAAFGPTGWMKVIGVCQLIGGLLVLSGVALPLGLCVLCPITFNILCFHLLLTGGHGIAGGAITAILELVLIYAYRESFAGVLSISEKPTA
jgi:hypothetical protein